MTLRPFESRASEASLNTCAEQRAGNSKNITKSTIERATFKGTDLLRLNSAYAGRISQSFFLLFAANRALSRDTIAPAHHHF
jgi:hypothetical protein